jgi:hypothetical protein
MKSTDWINLEEAASRLSATTDEITCMVREGILGSLIDGEGEVFVQAGEIDRLAEVFPPANAAFRGPQTRCLGRAGKAGSIRGLPA